METWEKLISDALTTEDATSLSSTDFHPLDSIRALEEQNVRWAQSACVMLQDQSVKASLALDDEPLKAALPSLLQVLRSDGEMVVISALTGLATLAETALLKSAAPIEAVARFERLSEHGKGPRIEIVGGAQERYRAFEEPVLAGEVQRRAHLPLQESILLTRRLNRCLARATPDRWGTLAFEHSSDDDVVARLLLA